jgi:predicted patatin/cPLA2 family phospholipase
MDGLPHGERDPVLDVILERVAAGSQPRRRSDPHRVCLAVEGGGMRAAVTAGMGAMLEEAGLAPAFDCVYGCSAGALNGAFLAAGQATLWAGSFEETANRRFIDRRRALRRRPVLDLGFLFEQVIGARLPLSAAGLARGPEFRAVAVSLDDVGQRVLRDFEDVGELMDAVRVSCSVPLLGGAPPVFRGERMVDGGLLESIPYRSALAEGATHVLVLRSREAGHRSRPYGRVAELALGRAHPELLPLLQDCYRRYNRDAEALEALGEHPAGMPLVSQVTVPAGSRLADRLSTDRAHLADSVRLGAAAMASMLLGEPARVVWRPVPYRSGRLGFPVADGVVAAPPS